MVIASHVFRVFTSVCIATNALTLTGTSYSISSACSTGAHCIGVGYEQIALGKSDIAFCGAGEAEDWGFSVYAHEHVIFFDKKELISLGTTVQKIEAKGLPLGNPQHTMSVEEKSFVDPSQKKLFRQRRMIYRHLMDKTRGNLLTSDIHQLRRMDIFEIYRPVTVGVLNSGPHRSHHWCGGSLD